MVYNKNVESDYSGSSIFRMKFHFWNLIYIYERKVFSLKKELTVNLMNTKKIALFLAILTSLSAVSCGSETSNIQNESTSVSDNETSNQEIQPSEINRENAVIGLPNLNFNGETINILDAGENVYAQDVYAEESGDVVDDAVYARNRSIEELLNITINPITYSESTLETADHLATIVLAGEDLYDLASVHQAYSAKYISEGYYHNFSGDKYIDFDKPWWNKEYMEEIVTGDNRIYFLVGDISLMYLKSLGCIYYNKEIYENIYKNADEPYELVFDGKWTLEKFDELVRGAYQDLNGDGNVNKGDLFGAYGTKVKSVEHFFYDAGVRSTTKNSDGIPELTLNNEHTIAVAEVIHKLYYENDGFLIASSDYFNDEINMFLSNEMLFAPTCFRHADVLRSMESDYGIICMPKYSEDDEYTTLVHDGTTVFVTPVTSKKTDMIGAICEAMAFYNYKTVTPAYYEVALKVKYSRDDMSSQMLDLISESAITNFGYAYASKLDSVPLLRTFVQNGAENFSSWYASHESNAVSGLQEVIDAYISMDN